jgi:hypothetical protein
MLAERRLWGRSAARGEVRARLRLKMGATEVGWPGNVGMTRHVAGMKLSSIRLSI